MENLKSVSVSDLLEKCGSYGFLDAVSGAQYASQRLITDRMVQKPGLALAGYHEHIRCGCVLMFGSTEIAFLDTAGKREYKGQLTRLFEKNACCVVISRGRDAPCVLLERADACGIPVLRTPYSSREAAQTIMSYLEDVLATIATLHGVFMDIYGVGTLITGRSGIGKSECAIELIKRGHRLVADDVIIMREKQGRLLGTSDELLRYHVELRGMGIVNVRDMFGVTSMRLTKQLEFAIHFTDRHGDDISDRLGVSETYMDILSHKIPVITCPLSPGRNMAVIVEVAARNHLLKMMGYDSSRDFVKKADERINKINY